MCARTVGKVCVWLRFVQPRLLRLIFLTACKTLANDMSHPVRALTLIFLGCPAAAPPRASSSRQRSRGRSRRSRSSNHRGAGDFHHPGLLASRFFALWVEGPARRSTDLSFPGVAGMARPLSSSLAGRARNTDGTHPRASSGARSVVSGPFPEASVADTAASLICPRLGPIHGGGAGPDVSGVVACSPWRYRRAGREAPIDRRFCSASIEPI